MSGDAGVFKDGEELELFPLRDGYFLLGKLPSAGPAAKEAGQPKLSEQELAVLRKLSAFRFEDRIPPEVNKTLNPAERAVLATLIEQKEVTIYSGGKYGKTGVYNIPKDIYPLLRAGPAQEQHLPPVFSLEHLNLKGYMIIENEGEVRRAVSMLHERIKSGEIIGVRAFDRRYYVASREFYASNEGKAHKFLGREGKSVDDLASLMKMAPEAAHVILTLMADSGDAIEKKRGHFASA